MKRWIRTHLLDIECKGCGRTKNYWRDAPGVCWRCALLILVLLFPGCGAGRAGLELWIHPPTKKWKPEPAACLPEPLVDRVCHGLA